jgi:hypothetical protein
LPLKLDWETMGRQKIYKLAICVVRQAHNPAGIARSHNAVGGDMGRNLQRNCNLS